MARRYRRASKKKCWTGSSEHRSILAIWYWTPSAGALPRWVVADRLGHACDGIDLSPLAVKLVNDRITADRGKDGGPATGRRYRDRPASEAR